MFGLIQKLLGPKNKNKNYAKNIEGTIRPFATLELNISWFKETLHNSSDLVIREFTNPKSKDLKGVLLYIDGLVDTKVINQFLLSPLLNDINMLNNLSTWESNLTSEDPERYVIPIGEVVVLDFLDQSLVPLLTGDTLLILSAQKKIYSFNTRGGKERSVAEPIAEQVIRGPRVGFVENLQVNISLIRRGSKDSKITFQSMYLGSQSKTKVVLAYHQDNVDKNALAELLQRLQKVDINRLEGTGILEQYMEDNTASVFPQFQYTERPDKVTAGLAEGRIGILVDGSPNVSMVPAPLVSFFQSSDDYLEKWHYGTALRWTRFICAFISSSLPSLYIAIISYHPELLPTNLAFSIGVTRLSVPFPAFIEAILMVFFLEVLQEAGIRLPKPMGQTVSIVGGLVIGQAAVQAGIVSPIMIIIISFTAISSFVIPSYNFNITTRLLRVPYIIATIFLGFYGLIMAWLLTLIHLCHLKTMGQNYMEGLSPFSKRSLDSVIRAPMKILNKKNNS